MSHSVHIPEILAPAGKIECLHAAVAAGADAVYLGLDEFNARRNADNFTIDNLVEACTYAHLRGVSIYVTMNVEILPSELPRALSMIARAWEAGADAFIVQDIGLAEELHDKFPEVPVHVSTQMNIHNAAGVAAVARMGAKRVTLARELSIAEIAELAELAAAFDMEVECFAHGAICVCYSGQCLMSSMIGGRSANRGLCAQACRLPYDLQREGREEALPSEGEHLLSPRDLCAIDLLGDLVTAGVSSLKIEGRMKSPDYVYAVVSVYRAVLDRLAEKLGSIDDGTSELVAEGVAPLAVRATPEERSRLAEAFSRGFTTAYLEGQRGNDIMSYGRPNNRGVFVGRIARLSDGFADIAPEVDLHAGDVLEFWTNRGHFAATVEDAKPGKDGLIRIPIDQRAGKGDRVFRVRNAEMAFEDDPFAPRVPVRGSIVLRIGQPAYISFTARGAFAEAEGAIVEHARTRAVSEQDVRDHVGRLGNTHFVLESLDVEMNDNTGMGFSQLHHLRADALKALERALLPERKSLPANFGEARVVGKASPKRPGALLVVAWASNPSCARAAKRAGAESIYVPLLNFRRGQAQLAGIRQDGPEQAGYPKQCVPALPTVDHDPVYAAVGSTRETTLPFDLWDYVREGKPVYADNLGDILRAIECGAQVEAGPHVPATNAAALRALADMGVVRVWLSPELTLGQIAELAEGSPVPLGLVVAGAQELMITEHCLLMSQGPCNEQCETCLRRSHAHYLRDRKGYDFPVVTDVLGRSHLYNGIELDAVPVLPDLLDLGISAVMVDTTLMDKRDAELSVARAVRACDLAVSEHRSVQKRQGATTGHLFRSVL